MSDEQPGHRSSQSPLTPEMAEYAAAARARGEQQPRRIRLRRPTRRTLVVMLALVGLIVVVAVALMLVSSGSAAAHTDLTSSDPPQGAQLDQAPTRVTLSFSDDMSAEFSKVTLTVGDSQPMILAPSTNAGTVSAPVPRDRLPALPSAGPGATPVPWSVAYRVVSADGHPVSGKIRFNAPLPRAPQAPQSPQPSSQLSPSAPPVANDDGSTTSARQDDLPPTAQSHRAGSEAVWWGVGIVFAVGLPLAAMILVGVAMMRNRRSAGS